LLLGISIPPGVMPDISYRASIFTFLRMDPRLQLAGMTKEKDERLLKNCETDGPQ